MKKIKFEQQYPGYKLIPSKASRLKGPLAMLGTLVGIAGLVLAVFYALSKLEIPVPNQAGLNQYSVRNLENLAISQATSGHFSEASLNFEKYFAIGGSSTEAMALYAYTLNSLGHREDAIVWSKKALTKDPQSKAARLVKETLDKKE